jgi:LmbE family N-acetylglucosaminyl deacetylase
VEEKMGSDLTPKSVLAVSAHPDDLEILCAGTLAKYGKEGVKVSMAIATDGRGGHMIIPPKELAEIRHREAERAAKIIEADFYLDFFGVKIDHRQILKTYRFSQSLACRLLPMRCFDHVFSVEMVRCLFWYIEFPKAIGWLQSFVLAVIKNY